MKPNVSDISKETYSYSSSIHVFFILCNNRIGEGLERRLCSRIYLSLQSRIRVYLFNVIAFSYLAIKRNEHIQHMSVPVYIHSQNRCFPAKLRVTHDLKAVVGDATVSRYLHIFTFVFSRQAVPDLL